LDFFCCMELLNLDEDLVGGVYTVGFKGGENGAASAGEDVGGGVGVFLEVGAEFSGLMLELERPMLWAILARFALVLILFVVTPPVANL